MNDVRAKIGSNNRSIKIRGLSFADDLALLVGSKEDTVVKIEEIS